MRRPGQTLRAVAFWTAVGFVAAYTGTYLKLNDEVLGDLISGRVNKVERGTFTLRSAHYPYLGGLASILLNTPVGVVGRDYQLRDPDGNVVLAASGVYADAYLRELVVSLARMAVTRRFYLTLHFAHARIPQAFGVIAPTRATWTAPGPLREINLVAAMSAKKPTPPDGGELRITVDDVLLEDACFAIGYPNDSGGLSWYGRLEGARSRAALVYSSRTALETADGPFFFFKVLPLEAPTGDLQLGDFHFPLADLKDVQFGPNGDRRQDLIIRARGRSLDASVTADGALTNAYSDHPGVRLQITFENGGRAAKLLPPPVGAWLGGAPRGTVHFDGPFTHVVIDGEVHDATADLDGLRIGALGTHLRLDQGVLRLDSLTGRAARGSVGGTIEVQLDDRPARDNQWSARLRLDGIDPAEVPQVPPSLRRALAGRLDGTVRLGGHLFDHPDRIVVHSFDAALEPSQPGRLPRRLKLAGAFELGPRVLVRTLTASGEGVTVSASGSVDPRSGGLAARVQLDAAAGAEWPHRLGVPSLLRADAVHAAGTVGGTVTHPEVSVHASASKLAYGPRALDKLEADLALTHGVVRLSNFGGAGLGGTVGGDAELTLFEGGDVRRPLAVPRVRAQVYAKGLGLGRLVGWSGITGDADMTLDLDGPLARPTGHAHLELPKLAIQGDPYHDGSLRLEFGGGDARVTELALKRDGGGSVSGGGQVYHDGLLALGLELKPRDFPLRAIPGVSSLPVALAGTLSGDIQLSGDENGWTPGGSASLFGFKIRDTLFGDGRLTLEPGGDAVRVHGAFFDNLVAVDGTLTLHPQLALNVTVKFHGVALERIFPEMRKLAEVRGVASGEANISWGLGTSFSAAIKLGELTLTFSTEEDGREHKLVLSNRDEVLLATDGSALHIGRAKFKSEIGDFEAWGDFPARHPGEALQLHGQIGLALLEYFFHDLFEHMHGNAQVHLTIGGDHERPEVNGTIDLLSRDNTSFIPRGLDHAIHVTSGHVGFDGRSVSLRDFNVKMDNAIAHASGTLDLDGWKPGAISADVSGELSPKLLQWVWPELIGEASGRVGVDVHIGGRWGQFSWKGSAWVAHGSDAHDVSVRVRRIDREVTIREGTIGFVNFDLALGCPGPPAAPVPSCHPIQGYITDEEGTFAVNGVVGLGNGTSLRSVDVSVDAVNQNVSTADFVVNFSPRVRLTGDGQRLRLRGEITLADGRYVRKYDFVEMALKAQRTGEQQEPFWQNMPLLSTMQLDLRVVSTGTLQVANEITKMNLSTYGLEIGGTLSEPRFANTIQIEEGAVVKLPGLRVNFVTNAGQILFDPDSKFPDDTPTFDGVSMTGVFIDRNETSHTILVRLGGNLSRLQLIASSNDGWDQATLFQVLVFGRTPDELRQLARSDPGANGRSGESASEALYKTASGMLLNELFSDPLRKTFRLDTASIEFGTGSVDFRLCWRFGRNFKTCGHGELGFLGGSRAEAFGDARILENLSLLGRVEYLTQGVETTEESITRGKLELNYRIPLGY